MTPLCRSIDDFLARLHRRYAVGATMTGPPAEGLRDLLALWPVAAHESELPAPRLLPACDHLDDALRAGRAGPEAALAETITALAPALVWTYGYPARPGRPDLSAVVAFSQIVGPAGLRRSERLRLGLTLIAPSTHYPPHAHPAIETYLVIGGTALWSLGASPAKAQPPGMLIFHPSLMPHAMQTLGDALVAVYSWHGDVTSPSVYLETSDS